MRTMKTTILALLVLCMEATTAFASDRGTTAADFLKIGMGANSAGLGEAYTAQYGDVHAMFYNPAGLVGLEMNQIAATHLNWIAETQYEALAYAKPIVGFGTLGVSFSWLHMPEIPGLDANGVETGMLQAYDMAVQFSYARDLSPYTDLSGLNGGVSMKIIHRELAGLSASGIAADIGALYQITETVSAGASCQNLGYLSSFDSARESLPVTVRLGAAYRADLLDDLTMTALMDMVKPLDNDVRANIGIEYKYAQIVSLRVGYKIGYDTEGLQAGAGVAWQNIAVDYALKFMGVFGVTHYVSASVGFGTTVQSMQNEEVKKILQEAEALYSQSRYQEALVIVEKALVVDAKNNRARQLHEKLQTVLKMLEMPMGNEPADVEKAPAPDRNEMTPDELEELEGSDSQEEQQ